MRRRAFRPEPPASLEGRSLLSGIQVPLPNPILLPRRQLNFILDHMQAGFIQYTRFQDVGQIYNEVEDVIVNIPFERVDGLDLKVNAILDTMRQDLRARVPNALGNALHAVINSTLAEVRFRVRMGDVIVR